MRGSGRRWIQLGGELARSVANPLGEGGIGDLVPVVDFATGEFAIRRVDRGRDCERGEEAEQGPQRMLDHERMTGTAAGRRDGHRLTGEPVGLDEVEHVLEESRIGPL